MAKTSSAASTPAKGPSKVNALNKPRKLSPELLAVIGADNLPSGQVTKKLWEYIKSNNLQDPKNKRNINADEKLKKIFGGKKTVTMFEMTKLVNQHLS